MPESAKCDVSFQANLHFNNYLTPIMQDLKLKNLLDFQLFDTIVTLT